LFEGKHIVRGKVEGALYTGLARPGTS